ncbi:MAG: MBL fold metallo-hydrolase [Muribaculaceae bacterium]|nr:MBL fold metallo-hydrolase [Muribaculaceae bacterium]
MAHTTSTPLANSGDSKIDITYIDHSGFAVVTPTAILVFDYFNDPTHSLPNLIKHNPGLPVYFLVSHHHYDHFNPDIFNLAQEAERVYVLSDDIKPQQVPDRIDAAWVRPGVTIDSLPGNIKVQAYGSTDVGVSFVVTLPSGQTIFHAGDLNYWHWNKEATVDEVKRAYGRFVKVLQSIMLDHKSLNVAFFPVDPRLGDDYADGARLFLENILVDTFIPMHFWGDYKSGCDFDNYTTDNTDSFCLHIPGETLSLQGKMALRSTDTIIAR